ncbi:MAG TPA: sterol desaturase family protein [Lautropia sp.]|jgi:beta-carotene 3-hydroxylase|nr:sterol desaturase family protein [Lautropia sp.]
MHPALGFLILVATVIGMETVAYAVHRWIMHGPGWFLHRSHHEPAGKLEANDLYGLIFAIPSVLLIYGGMNRGWPDWTTWVGWGVAAYGLIYFGFHDVIVHKRLPHRLVPRSAYLKRIVQAHRLHHAVDSRTGAVSFGFLWAPRPERLKAKLDKERLRAPTGR